MTAANFLSWVWVPVWAVGALILISGVRLYDWWDAERCRRRREDARFRAAVRRLNEPREPTTPNPGVPERRPR